MLLFREGVIVEYFPWILFKFVKVVNIIYKIIDERPQLLSIVRFASIFSENGDAIVFSCNVCKYISKLLLM